MPTTQDHPLYFPSSAVAAGLSMRTARASVSVSERGARVCDLSLTAEGEGDEKVTRMAMLHGGRGLRENWPRRTGGGSASQHGVVLAILSTLSPCHCYIHATCYLLHTAPLCCLSRPTRSRRAASGTATQIGIIRPGKFQDQTGVRLCKRASLQCCRVFHYIVVYVQSSRDRRSAATVSANPLDPHQ
jgi:hypothetical protein